MISSPSAPGFSRLRRVPRGFSLVETLVAAAILAITVSGFYLTFGGANELATKARLNTSAKILLGAAVNEALSSRWTATNVPDVARNSSDTTAGELYNTANEGVNARPTARREGQVAFFTSPTEETVVMGELRKITTDYVEPGGRVRLDMKKVTFKVKYTYKGVDSPWLEANTVITRD
ncbi:MAG: prepilin-type N-terminal cleavage/methylation domain-containing protein [Verrucomicrobia bacterium]|nr:prepilin-type N-terminal cleavage/methylation domain-containing protein [Verrucomicrobiota bacterium]